MANGLDDTFVDMYSTRGHAFQIDTKTKTSWIQKKETAIPISLVAKLNNTNSSEISSSSKGELKIIGRDESGIILLESDVSPKTNIAKRSQKFGQWTDPTGMVYGLGFNSEAELDEFVATFLRLQREILSPTSSISGAQQKAPDIVHGDKLGYNDNNSGQSQPQQKLNSVSEINGRSYNTNLKMADGVQYSNNLTQHQQQLMNNTMKRQQATMGMKDHEASLNNNGHDDSGSKYSKGQTMYGMQTEFSNSSVGGRGTPEDESSSALQNEWQSKEQLKYENERLKQALEENTKTAGVWQNELINLRTNNVKLTQALQESKAHVEEWERELLSLRDENKELKMRLMAFESSERDDPIKNNEYKVELQKYKNYVNDIQSELRKRENEVEDLQRSMEQLELKAKSSGQNGHVNDPTSAEIAISSHQKQKFDVINAKLEAKIGDILNVQKEFAQLVDKLYH